MEIDKSQFIALFKQEADEYLAILNQGLVKLEKTPEDGPLLDELLRVAHTLKGSARMLGFVRIRDIAHKMEDLFSLMREGQCVFQPAMADVFFMALDRIQKGVAAVSQGLKEDIETEDIIKKLEVFEKDQNPETIENNSAEDKPADEEDKPVPVLKPEPVIEKECPPPAEDQEDKRVDKPVKENAPVQSQVPQKPPVEQSQDVPEEFIRVPLNRINHLLNLIGEIVIDKVKSGYKINSIKKITQQANQLDRLILDLQTSAKEALDIPDDFIQKDGAVLRASQEMDVAHPLMGQLHEVQSLYKQVLSEWIKVSEEIQNDAFYLNPVVDELQHKMKEIRMLPCSMIFEGFPRLIRDLERELDKKVSFSLYGSNTELDKKVLEAIKAPLIHILRNAVDHGVESSSERLAAGKPETAQVNLRAFQEGGKVIITVEDDGRGIDPEVIAQAAVKKKLISEEDLLNMSAQQKINLVFLPGFSTAKMITDISGRGVGMDVVRTEIEALKGNVELISQVGQGSKIKIELPLTIAIMLVMLVNAGGILWALPMANIEECVTVTWDQVKTIQNRMMIQLQDESIPIIFLSDLVNITAKNRRDQEKEEALKRQIAMMAEGAVEEECLPAKSLNDLSVVIASSMKRRVGFIIDRIQGEDEIFIKHLGKHLGNIQGVSGAANLASGEMVVVLDLRGLIEKAYLGHKSYNVRQRKTPTQKKSILIVEDSLTTRELEKSILENVGYRVETAIDGLDGLEKLTKGSFDAVISDIQMPRMNGFEFCRALKTNAETKDIPVIFVTSMARDEEKRQGMDVGAQAYIVKSQFDQATLLQTLARLI
ncbi:MAG: hybrid sensor histidine kinase/response regulator [Candidatus Omnitrophica bacterium]|nr:hybrid sensor histidine kinase/response regulator [Candidatus Omnitrophota bacterium]